MSEFILNNSFLPVPLRFAEHFLRDANGTFVKVYLFMLSLAVSGRQADNAEIARELNILESDVVQAISYWSGCGVLVEENGKISFCSLDAAAPAEEAETPHIPTAAKIMQSPETAQLLSLAETMFGRPLTPSEMETLCWICDELSFSPEAVLMLLEYCINRDKKQIKYIEKVAIAWHEKGITDMKGVEAYIKSEEERKSYLYALRKSMGLLDRQLSKSEQAYFAKWHDTHGMSDEMILLAYDYCVTQTAKLSFPYMDKIIERWAANNIRSIEAAEEDNKKFRRSSASGSDSVYSDSYDHDALEKLNRRL